MIRLGGILGIPAIKEEAPANNAPTAEPQSQHDDHEGRMAKSDLLAIHKQAGEIYNMIGEDEQLEGWIQEKVSLAADYINNVYNSVKYEKNKPATVGNGEEAPAEDPMKTGGPMNESWSSLVNRLLSERGIK